MKLFLYSFREFDEKDIFDELKEKYGFEYGFSAEYPSLENAALAKGYDAISMTPCTMDAEILDAFYALGVKYVAARSIGYDHIDIAHAKQLGMGVSHVTYDPDAVADYAILLMLMGCRKMGYILERSKLQDYSLIGKLGRDIGDCTVGIIGAGQIGRTVIRHLSAFESRILAYDLYPNEAMRSYCQYVSLEELIRQSDIISIHAPASKENYHLLGRQEFEKMKPGVMLVNTARGTLIDTDVLIENLVSGKVSFAGLDVLEKEDGLYYHNRMGDCIDNVQMAQLRAFPNVVLTPHTAFYTKKVVYSMAENVVKCVFDMQNQKENPLINTY